MFQSLGLECQMCAIKSVLLTQWLIVGIQALTGHACRRRTQETYLVQSSRAFLCNERYTTSCGHLDWRRCTRYRVQTCYTPTQRYATRYREIEECCPGWQQSADSCNIPVCHGLCQNGGVCSQTGAVPHCSCLPGYYGDSCQHKRESTSSLPSPSSSSSNTLSPEWMVIIAVLVMIGLALVLIAFFVLRKSLQSSSAASQLSTQSTFPAPCQSSPTTSTPTATTATTSQSPIATISESMMASRIVQPSAPSSMDSYCQ